MKAVRLVMVATMIVTVGVSAEELSLEPPGFAAAKLANTQQTSTAFPTDKAGMAAYAKVSQAIVINSVKSIFSQVEEVGDNYIYGVVPILNFGDTTRVHLYADTTGWLVAYLTRSEPAAKLMQWLPADIDNPKITTIPRTTLTDALTAAGNAAGVSVLPQIKYYNFKFPDATTLAVLVKTRNDDGTNLMQVEIPADYTLYEASYYHYTVKADDSQLKVDGTLVSDAPRVPYSWWIAADSYKGAISIGILHTIEISYDDYDRGSAGVATVLIYKPSR